MTDTARLQTGQAEKKVWLVKFPPVVAQRLHALAASNPPGGKGTSIGVARSTADIDQKNNGFKLELNEAAFQNMPTTYAMRPNGGNTDSTYTFCKDGPAHAVEGRIDKRFDVGMLHDDRLQAQGDPRYRSLTRERKDRAATKTRIMQMIDDPRGLNIRALPKVSAPKKATSGADTRRVRMDRDELENVLFGLFARQPAWPFIALEKETNQPVPWLKEVLNGIATMVRTAGVNQNKWVLKKELQT